MPLCKVTKDSYIDGRYYKAGDVLNYNGPMGSGIEAMTPDEREAYAKQWADAAKALPSDFGARLDALELAVGKDAIKAAVEKRAAEQREASEKAAAEAKTKADTDRKAGIEAEAAAQKAVDDINAAKAADPAPAPVAEPAKSAEPVV